MGRWVLALCALLLPLLHDQPGYAEPALNRDSAITIYPVTTGQSSPPARPIASVLVLGLQSNPSTTAAIAAAKEVFHRGGVTIIEQAPPRSPKPAHGPHVQKTDAVDAELLAFGKTAGADHLILLDVTDTLVLDNSGRSLTEYLHDEHVLIRGIDVETGAVVLEGTARWSQPVERPGQYIRQLTAFAIARALCLPEKWEEASADNNGRGKCRR